MLCKVMQVSRSGYYSWKKRDKSKRDQERDFLIPRVKELHSISRGTYGRRRMAFELETTTGIPCGKHKAGTLMKLAGVEVKKRKKFKVTTNSKHRLPVSPNLLSRCFTTQESDKVYVGDITYIWTSEGWLYLAVVIDLFSRKVVGWAMDKRMTKRLVIDALIMAVWRRKPCPRLMFHSDRGSQYCSHDFQNMLKQHKIVSSMSRKGDCWDNAVAESFFGTLKTELIHGASYITRDQAKGDIVNYIEMFYNCRRLHSYLGYMSPMDWERKVALQKVA